MSSSEGERSRRPRLVRSRRGRLIGGVCSGLGAHFNVDPILFRIAFVGLAIFSGVGIGLYLVILLLVPEEGASRAPIHLCRSSWRSILGVVTMIVAAAIALHAVAHARHGGAWGIGVGVVSLVLVGGVAALAWLRLRMPAGDLALAGDVAHAEGLEHPAGGALAGDVAHAEGFEHPAGDVAHTAGDFRHASADRRLLGCLALGTALLAWAVLLALAGAWLAGTDEQLAAWAVVAMGAGLVLCAFIGGARRLVLPAVAFALAVATVAAAHVDLHGGVGERTYRPHTLSELRDSYQLGAGRLEVDLRELTFPPGDTRLHVQLGVGELVVLVPHGVCVAIGAQIGGGFVGALENRSGGLDVDWVERPSPPLQTPRLVLDGTVGLGALLVADRPVERAWNGWGSWGGEFGSHRHPGVYGTNEACRPSVGVGR
jgi:phage shock protein PspC (stress-responsive transcriptional regulator)